MPVKSIIKCIIYSLIAFFIGSCITWATTGFVTQDYRILEWDDGKRGMVMFIAFFSFITTMAFALVFEHSKHEQRVEDEERQAEIKW
jgi:hypothetical protein